jgi:predicted nucleotidyltransferase
MEDKIEQTLLASNGTHLEPPSLLSLEDYSSAAAIRTPDDLLVHLGPENQRVCKEIGCLVHNTLQPKSMVKYRRGHGSHPPPQCSIGVKQHGGTLPCPFFIFKNYSGTRLPEDPYYVVEYPVAKHELGNPAHGILIRVGCDDPECRLPEESPASRAKVDLMAKTAMELSEDERRSYRPWQNLQRYRKDPEVDRRWDQTWDIARRAARLLREQYGAARVVVFGSLVHRDWFTPWSDIDIAVSGVPAGKFYRAIGAAYDIGAEAGFKVDVIDPAECSPEMLQSVLTEGMEL